MLCEKELKWNHEVFSIELLRDRSQGVMFYRSTYYPCRYHRLVHDISRVSSIPRYTHQVA